MPGVVLLGFAFAVIALDSATVGNALCPIARGRLPSEECFDCVVSSCYQVESAKAVANGVAASDVLDVCETTAGSFCNLSDPI